jgi:hypothetical protein
VSSRKSSSFILRVYTSICVTECFHRDENGYLGPVWDSERLFHFRFCWLLGSSSWEKKDRSIAQSHHHYARRDLSCHVLPVERTQLDNGVSPSRGIGAKKYDRYKWLKW